MEFKNFPIFLDFIKGLLQIDPSKRWPASKAIKHPFITKSLNLMEDIHVVLPFQFEEEDEEKEDLALLQKTENLETETTTVNTTKQEAYSNSQENYQEKPKLCAYPKDYQSTRKSNRNWNSFTDLPQKNFDEEIQVPFVSTNYFMQSPAGFAFQNDPLNYSNFSKTQFQPNQNTYNPLCNYQNNQNLNAQSYNPFNLIGKSANEPNNKINPPGFEKKDKGKTKKWDNANVGGSFMKASQSETKKQIITQSYMKLIFKYKFFISLRS